MIQNDRDDRDVVIEERHAESTQGPFPPCRGPCRALDHALLMVGGSENGGRRAQGSCGGAARLILAPIRAFR